MSKAFQLDVRNAGGLKQVADNMYNHHKNILSAKPAINNKPPISHVNRQKQKQQQQDSNKTQYVDLPMYKNKQDFNNVFKTFQTVLTMKKGGIDSSAPQAMNYRRNITGNVSKQEKHVNEEHLKNLQSQYRRIHSAYKLLEHMTKKHRNFEESSVQSTFSDAVEKKQRQKLQMEGGKQQKKQKQTKKEIKIEKPRTADGPKQVEDITAFVNEIPKVDNEDYEELKKQIIVLVTIFKHRVYRTEDLETLFGRVLIHNPDLQLEKAEKMFQEIRDEFLE